MMDAEARATALRRAIAAWDLPDGCADAVELDGLFARATERAGGHREPPSADLDSMLIVAKAPHAGSFESVVDIAARSLAFGLKVVSVSTLPAGSSRDVAHALYPDVWLNFARPPTGDRVWSRLRRLFDQPLFTELFGVPFSPDMVKEGQRACEENGLALGELASIWELGRLPLTRENALESYGARARDVIFSSSEPSAAFNWYRCAMPIGIQKLASSHMAFAMRHERLYEGAPTIIVNGQFSLLSRLFDYSDHGAVVVEVGLPAHRSAADFRRLLIGESDAPTECRPGSIRRDAADGLFPLDDVDRPVTPWANVVHASDGYLSGAIEVSRLLPASGPSRFQTLLAAEGYSDFELDEMVMKDPIVISSNGESRLTHLTKGTRYADCVGHIRRYFPSQTSLRGGQVGDGPLRELLRIACRPDPREQLERAVAAAGDRPPERVRHRDQLDPAVSIRGRHALERGAVGCLIPMAGSGGRFGGYDKDEGSGDRLKALSPVFNVGTHAVSALDVRGGHLRNLGTMGATVASFLSCGGHTEVQVRSWAEHNADLASLVGRVPEGPRIRVPSNGAGGYRDSWEATSNLLRASTGDLLVKPLGSMGLLWAAFDSGALEKWIGLGIDIVVAANADDVGFRLDPAVIGMIDGDHELDAVVIVVSSPAAESTGGRPAKGGLLRDRRTAGGGLSRYVQENATSSAEPRWLNTNQIYFRTTSLAQALEGLRAGTGGRMPYYCEAKRAKAHDEDAVAWHVYQPYGDVLRVMDRVEALSMHASPHAGQPGAFRPLKTPDDVPRAQATIDELLVNGDELTFGQADA
jgi:hypothetical protein